MKIIGIYKITNTITGDFYIGSSKNVKQRWREHKSPSRWNKQPNNQMYQDMQKYGVDKFVFEILAEVEIYKLKEIEQKFIETLKPTYNDRNAKGWNIERFKESKREYQKEYNKTDKGKESQREYQKTDKGKESQREYQKTDKYKEYQKDYEKTEKGKESLKKARNKYNNKLCSYNGETLTLNALRKRFQRRGIDHPTLEAKKYLIKA